MHQVDFNIQDALRAGSTAQQSGDVKTAQKHYKSILVLEPFHAQAHHNFGILRANAGDLKNSLRSLRAALKIQPRNQLFWISQVQILINFGNLNFASKILKNAKKKDIWGQQFKELETFINTNKASSPPFEQTLNEITALIRGHSLDKALNIAISAIKNFPKNSQILYLIAEIQSRLGDPMIAQKYYKKSIIIEPEIAARYATLGVNLSILDDNLAAVEQNRRALTLDNSFFQAYNNLGALFGRLAQYQEAINNYELALKIKPDYAKALSAIGALLQMDGQTEKAHHYIRKTLVLQPKQAEAYSNLGANYHQSQRYKQAIYYFKQALFLNPLLVHPQINLGAALSKSGNDKASEFSYKMALVLQPNSATSCNDLGYCFERLGKVEQAIKLYQWSLITNPKLPDAHNNLGNLYSSKGFFSKAISSYSLAIVKKYDFASAYNNLGKTFLQLGELQASKINQIKSILLCPNLKEANYNLSLTLKDKGERDASLKQLRFLLIISPEDGASLHLKNILLEKTTKFIPRQYVEDLFNDYAERFDHHLVHELEYDIPRLVCKMVYKVMPSKKPIFRAIDLGCGTGLSGLAFKHISKSITGIDLSRKMIQKAEGRKIYDKLVIGEINDVLVEMIKTQQFFDLFICTDVLVYLGDCTKLFSSIKKLALPNALIGFSIENYDGPKYKILGSGRYGHSTSYIEDCAKYHGFKIVGVKPAKIRREKHNAIKGTIFLLQSRNV